MSLFKKNTERSLSILDIEKNKPIIEAALKELNATIVERQTLRGVTYISGAKFETEEDLLYFKLKFN